MLTYTQLWIALQQISSELLLIKNRKILEKIYPGAEETGKKKKNSTKKKTCRKEISSDNKFDGKPFIWWNLKNIWIIHILYFFYFFSIILPPKSDPYRFMYPLKTTTETWMRSSNQSYPNGFIVSRKKEHQQNERIFGTRFWIYSQPKKKKYSEFNAYFSLGIYDDISVAMDLNYSARCTLHADI